MKTPWCRMQCILVGEVEVNALDDAEKNGYVSVGVLALRCAAHTRFPPQQAMWVPSGKKSALCKGNAG